MAIKFKKFGTKKTWKMVLNVSSITAISAAAITGAALAVKGWTQDKTLAKLDAPTMFKQKAMEKDANGRNKLLLKTATLSFGNHGSLYFDINKWNNLVNQGDSTLAARKAMGEEFQQRFIQKRKETSYNPTLTIRTENMSFRNNYVDVFTFNDFMEYVDFILNDVSWGPDVLTLSEFEIVRGRNQLGQSLVLGAHDGSREQTKIAFYPDSFFGIQTIYSPGKGSVLVDTSNLLYSGNESIVKMFVKHFNKYVMTPGLLNKINNPELTEKTEKVKVEGVEATSEKLYNYELDEDFAKKFLSKKVFDDYIMNLSSSTINSISRNILLTVPQEKAEERVLPGNFSSVADFIDYVHAADKIPVVDVITDVRGKEKIVYPRRYFYRLLTTLYLKQTDENYSINMAKNDVTRKSNLTGGIINVANGQNNTKPHADGTMPTEGIRRPIEYGIDPETGNFTLDDMNDINADNIGIWSQFRSFNSSLSQDMVLPIAKIIEASIGIKPVKKIKSVTYDSFGNLKMSLLYKKYMGVLETMKEYKKKYNWSPLNFDKNGVPNLNEFVPNTYLYMYMDRQVGFKDALQQDGIYATTSQIDKDDELSRKKVAHLGIEWLKYTTSHEYGHHQTLFYSKDISNTLDKSSMIAEGIYDTALQSYSGASTMAHGYGATYSRDYINALLRARTGGGDLNDFSLGLNQNHGLNALTTQISHDSYKEKMKFMVANAASKDSLPGRGLNEDFSTSYDDYASSWRGFKTYDQLIAASATQAEINAFRAANPGEPTTAPLAPLLMNSFDESSFTLNPSIATPLGAFGTSGSQLSLDPAVDDNPEISYSHFTGGWDGASNGGNNIRMTENFTSFSEYKHPFLDAAGNVVTMLNWKGETVPTLTDERVPSSMGTSFLKETLDLDTITGDIPDEAIYPDINANTNDNFSVGTETWYRKANMANLYAAKDVYVTLYKDSTGKYFAEDNAAGTLTKERVKAVSMSFAVGRTGNFMALPILASLYGQNLNQLTDLAPADRKAKLIQDILVEINKDHNAKVLVDKPIANVDSGKDAFSEWMKRGIGLPQETETKSAMFLKYYSKGLFSKYWSRVGRFVDYSDSPADFHPMMSTVFSVGMSDSITQNLNNVYSTYLSTGAYSLYQDILTDYETTLPEQLTRDLNQIAYAPSKAILPGSDNKSEYASGASLYLAPIFIRTFTNDGMVQPLPATSHGWGYDPKTFKMYSKQTTSGFWKDYAMRRETDSTLYVSPSVAASRGQNYQALSKTGKAYINFLKDSEGIRSDTDISGIFLNKQTGFSQMFGYINKEDADKFKYLAFQDPSGKVQYVPISMGHSNQFFYEHFGQADTRKSLLKWHYDSHGNLVQDDHEQVAWASDYVLSSGYANTIFKSNTQYKMYFTEGQSLHNSRFVNLGSQLRTIYDNGTQEYSVKRTQKTKLFNNGFDEYSGTIKVTQALPGRETYFLVREVR